MDSFKSYDEIMCIDKQHLFLQKMGGKEIDLPSHHSTLEAIQMHAGVPQVIRSQFNIARNMALYSYFFYSLGSEVQLKACNVIEHALRIKAKRPELMLRQLLTLANEKNWLADSNFKHIGTQRQKKGYCKSLERVLPHLRNESAHGVPPLVWDCVGHIERCADLVNQLFPRLSKAG
ncbi:MAG: hypothetical protein ACPH64_04315 [Porticoccaceae bacterium]